MDGSPYLLEVDSETSLFEKTKLDKNTLSHLLSYGGTLRYLGIPEISLIIASNALNRHWLLGQEILSYLLKI